MSPTSIVDLAGLEVEHLLGLGTGLPLVKIRALGEHVVMLGHLSPADAREVAAHLAEAAARAEYELDLISAAKRHGVPDDAALFMLGLVRSGERQRHEGQDG